MTISGFLRSVLAFSVLCLMTQGAVAQEEKSEGAGEPEAAPEEETSSKEVSVSTEDLANEENKLGINVDVGFATAYVFRGLNIFKDDDQRDQNTMIAPGISWSIFDTGLTLGYWAAYQLNGDDVGGNIDGGVGAEQDLYLTYDLELPYNLGLGAWVYYYFYPAADEDVAGVANPSYLEPGLRFGIYSAIFVEMNVAYFAGLQEDIRDFSYLYLSPAVGTAFNLHEKVAFELRMSYGYKVWKDDSIEDNTHDFTFGAALPISLPYGFYVKPAVGVARTNFEKVAEEDAAIQHLPSGEEARIAVQPHETVVWGSINVGIDL